MLVEFTATHDEWGTTLALLNVPRAQSSSTETIKPATYLPSFVPAEPGSEGVEPVMVQQRSLSLLQAFGEYHVTLIYDNSEQAATAVNILTTAGFANVRLSD
jgi:hypothetical protein